MFSLSFGADLKISRDNSSDTDKQGAAYIHARCSLAQLSDVTSTGSRSSYFLCPFDCIRSTKHF